MLNWKKWCRLCGSLENNQEIEPDIEGIVLQFFEVTFLSDFYLLVDSLFNLECKFRYSLKATRYVKTVTLMSEISKASS